MKVCYFGIYNPLYSRNRILIQGLRKNGVEVVECHSDKTGIERYLDLAQKLFSLKNGYDVLVVGYPGYQVAILARFLTRKPVIFDAFSPLYDSMVFDRKIVTPRSARALYYWCVDWLSMKLSDLVLFDTEAHIRYACREFHLDEKKFRRIWIGAYTDIFSPMPHVKKEVDAPFSVLFFGSFIPLQGVEYILYAAKSLEREGIHFSIIGNGQTKQEMLGLKEKLALGNVMFHDELSQGSLKREIVKADICLGIFGSTPKTMRVIPNKVYECLAMKKPVITADTPAARELLSDKAVLLVRVADALALSRGILRLKNDKAAMEILSRNGYDTLIANASPEVLGRDLKNIVREVSKT